MRKKPLTAKDVFDVAIKVFNVESPQFCHAGFQISGDDLADFVQKFSMDGYKLVS